MSVANFIPEIWSTGILKERDKVMIGAKHCNRDYEGDIKKMGDRVKILTIGDVASYDYTRNTDINAPDLLTDEAQWLDIDNAKYCHVFIDDIDQAQANQKLMAEAQRKLGVRMADDIDQDIFAEYVNAGKTIDAYTTAVTSANIITYLAAINQAFQEANVPEGERKFLEVTPAIYNKMILARIGKETMNTKVIDGANVPVLYGFEIYVSNNIPIVGGTRHKCIARTQGAISFASQITENVAYQPEKRFGDALKSLQAWGVKTVRPKELVLFDCAIGTEA
jgi:hypothetical protein